MNSEESEIVSMAEHVFNFLSLTIPNSFAHSSQIQKGVSCARSDDTKSLKGVVLDWILPRNGVAFESTPQPTPLSRNVKTNRGFHHPVTGALLCPAGLDWKNLE